MASQSKNLAQLLGSVAAVLPESLPFVTREQYLWFAAWLSDEELRQMTSHAYDRLVVYVSQGPLKHTNTHKYTYTANTENTNWRIKLA